MIRIPRTVLAIWGLKKYPLTPEARLDFEGWAENQTVARWTTSFPNQILQGGPPHSPTRSYLRGWVGILIPKNPRLIRWVVCRNAFFPPYSNVVNLDVHIEAETAFDVLNRNV